jgi:hypothetical protein
MELVLEIELSQRRAMSTSQIRADTIGGNQQLAKIFRKIELLYL